MNLNFHVYDLGAVSIGDRCDACDGLGIERVPSFKLRVSGRFTRRLCPIHAEKVISRLLEGL